MCLAFLKKFGGNGWCGVHYKIINEARVYVQGLIIHMKDTVRVVSYRTHTLRQQARNITDSSFWVSQNLNTWYRKLRIWPLHSLNLNNLAPTCLLFMQSNDSQLNRLYIPSLPIVFHFQDNTCWQIWWAGN